MSLTDEMNRMYQLPKHGFLRDLPKKDVSSLTEEAYADLWNTPFREYLDSFETIVLSNQQRISQIEDIFRSVLGFNPPAKMHDIAVEKLSRETFGGLLKNRENIINELKREEEEINADYTENYGQKKDHFLKAVRYVPDGHEIDFFFHYWRRPLYDLIRDRHVDIYSDAGQKESAGILKDLFGSEAVNYQMTDLLNETPEHLIERKKEIEERRKELLRNQETEKEVLFDKPFFETLEKFIGVHFIDKSNVELMASQVCDRADAHEKLKEFVKTDETFDKDLFVGVLNETPRNISYQADSLISSLCNRNDNRYLEMHPTATFGEFLSNRRKGILAGTLEGEKIGQKALQFILGSNEPVDNKTVKLLKEVPCWKINQDREKIIEQIKSRRIKRYAVLTAALSGMLAVFAFASYKTIEGINQLGKKTTPIVQNTKEKIKETFTKKETEKKKIEKKETARTEIKKGSEEKNTKSNNTQKITKKPLSIKGNRPILGDWKAWTDTQCTKQATGMFQRLLTSEFNFLIDTVQKTGLPVYQTIDVENTGKAVMMNENTVVTKALQGENALHFYVKRGLNDAENLKNDVVKYHKNIKDVLDTLPVHPDKLPESQLLAMEAIGPSMGWSIRQQVILQQKNPQLAQEAQTFIFLTTEDMLKQQNSNKNDMDAVFTAVMQATKSYRHIHPECNFLLLSADSVIRQIANIENTEAKQFKSQVNNQSQVSSDRTVSQGCCSPRKKKETNYTWLWIIGTAALTSYLGSEYWKGKAEIVK